METVTTDQGTFEYVGEFHYEDGTVHRYRRIDTPEKEKEEIIMGIKKICLQYQLRKQKEAEEQKRKEQEEKNILFRRWSSKGEKKNAGDSISRGTEDIGREDTQESVGVSEV